MNRLLALEKELNGWALIHGILNVNPGQIDRGKFLVLRPILGH